MRVGVAGHVADSYRDAVAHPDDAQLRDGVLFEELVNEGRGVGQHEQVPGGPEVFLVHRQRHVENQDQMSNDTPL